MSRAAVSLFVFGIYLLVLGLVLLTVPNLLLAVFGLPATTEVWIRVAGLLVDILGFYYVCAARAELLAFFRWTVSARMAVIFIFAAFVAFGIVKPILLVFGAIDFVAAMWTSFALRRDRAST